MTSCLFPTCSKLGFTLGRFVNLSTLEQHNLPNSTRSLTADSMVADNYSELHVVCILWYLTVLTTFALCAIAPLRFVLCVSLICRHPSNKSATNANNANNANNAKTASGIKCSICAPSTGQATPFLAWLAWSWRRAPDRPLLAGGFSFLYRQVDKVLPNRQAG